MKKGKNGGKVRSIEKEKKSERNKCNKGGETKRIWKGKGTKFEFESTYILKISFKEKFKAKCQIYHQKEKRREREEKWEMKKEREEREREKVSESWTPMSISKKQ